MTDFLIRDLDDETMRRLKSRAALAGRSLQAEIQAILRTSAGAMTREELRATFERWREEDRGREYPDLTAIIRRHRDAWRE